MPEQPEHEEARCMAEEAMPAQAEALAMAEHEEGRCPPGCPKCAAEYLDAKERAEHEEARRLAERLYPYSTRREDVPYPLVERLLSKAEQERDDARKGVAAGYGLMGQWRKREAEMKARAEATERELERLREALLTWENYDLAIRDGRQEDAAHFYESMVEKFDALSADTLREPEQTGHRWYCDRPDDHEGACKASH